LVFFGYFFSPKKFEISPPKILIKIFSQSRQIKQKEYELEKKLQRYNEALANNKHLRNQINSLRKERTLYDKIYNNLELDIMNKKNELLKLIEISDKLEAKKIE
jgi:hypothetical protein